MGATWSGWQAKKPLEVQNPAVLGMLQHVLLKLSYVLVKIVFKSPRNTTCFCWTRLLCFKSWVCPSVSKPNINDSRRRRPGESVSPSGGLELKFREDFTYQVPILHWMMLHHDRVVSDGSTLLVRASPGNKRLFGRLLGKGGGACFHCRYTIDCNFLSRGM